MGTTPDFGIPELSQGQANPDITHNEAIVKLQTLLNGVKDKDLTAPPVSPVEGDAYLINTAAPTGAWTGHGKQITVYWGGTWRFIPGYDDDGAIIAMGARQEGMNVYVRDEDRRYTWRGLGSPVAFAWSGTLVTAAEISNTPAGNIAATDVQAAINELDTEKIAIAGHTANSVVGRASNSSGGSADIAAGTNDRFLAQTSNALSFVQLTNGMVPTNTVGLDKLVNASAQYNIMSRTTAAAGAWEQKASSADVFSVLGAANFAAIRTLLSLGAAALLGVATDTETRAMASSSVLITPANLASRTAFHANKNATNQTGIATGTFTKITFTNEVFDVGGFYDGANSKFAPTPVGKYRLTGKLRCTGATVSTVGVVSIFKNGVRHLDIQGFDVGVSGFFGAGGTAIVDNDGNDEFEIYYSGVTAGTITADGTVEQTYFQGEAV